MKIITIITLLVALLFLNCQKEIIDNESMFKILRTAIDTSLRIDPSLNEVDTLFIEFSKRFVINDSVNKSLINYLNNKGAFQIVLSDLESILETDPLSPDHPNLRNFCITVLDVKHKTRNTIAVSTRKYKGMLAADIIQTIFKFEKRNWLCIESRIISAS